MIQHYLGLGELGLYGIGYRISSIIGIMVVGFVQALPPLIFDRYQLENTPGEIAKIFRIFTGALLICYLAISLFGHFILRVFTTPDYYAAASLIVYLVPVVALAQMYIFTPGMHIKKRTGIIGLIYVASAAINAGLNVILIPRLGLEGAGLATLIGYLFFFSMYTLFSQRLYPVPHAWKPLLLAAGAISILAWGIPQLSFPWPILLCVKLAAELLGVVVVVQARLIRLEDIRQLINLVCQRMMPQRI
jgi:O-antigen/teichoic acid export membrane protein